MVTAITNDLKTFRQIFVGASGFLTALLLSAGILKCIRRVLLTLQKTPYLQKYWIQAHTVFINSMTGSNPSFARVRDRTHTEPVTRQPLQIDQVANSYMGFVFDGVSQAWTGIFTILRFFVLRPQYVKNLPTALNCVSLISSFRFSTERGFDVSIHKSTIWRC